MFTYSGKNKKKILYSWNKKNPFCMVGLVLYPDNYAPTRRKTIIFILKNLEMGIGIFI